jgi:dolichyl-phosphate beta-glucosyltransferase
VSLVAPTVETSPVVGQPAGPGRRPWLVLCCYLAAALVVTWRLWADPATRVQIGDPHDVDLYAWFLRYEATAVAHGRLPALVTTALNPPHGVGLMWNTSLLLPGVLLAPLTLLAGPQVTLTTVLTLGFAGSAASLFLVLRRRGASVTAAALGGAVYGFSPALLNSGLGHYSLQFAVLPPLLLDVLARIVTGRGHPLRTGAWLGLLAAAQLLTGEELLTDTALAGLILTLALLALPAARRPAPAGRIALGLVTAVTVALLGTGRALWTQFHGPLGERYVPRYTHYTSYFGAHPAVFVTPPGSLLFHTSASAAAAAGYPTHLSEYLAYLGWPLLTVLAAAAVRYWHDPRARVMAITLAVLELLSLGGRYRYLGPLLPWHWLQALPVLGELLPDRLAVLADAAAAALLAFALDRARGPIPGWRGRTATAVAVLAVLPLVPLPYPAAPAAPVPPGWQAAFARLRLAASAPVLVVPVPDNHFTQAMRWQADTGVPGSLIGGFFLGPAPSGVTRVDPGPAEADAQYLDPLWAGWRPAQYRSGAQISADIAYWHPAAVVEVLRPGSRLRPLLNRLLGRPAFRVGRVMVWRRGRASSSSWPTQGITSSAWSSTTSKPRQAAAGAAEAAGRAGRWSPRGRAVWLPTARRPRAARGRRTARTSRRPGPRPRR